MIRAIPKPTGIADPQLAQWAAQVVDTINPTLRDVLVAGAFRWKEIAGANGAAPTFALQVAQRGVAWTTIANFTAAGVLVQANPMLSAATSAGQSIPNNAFTTVVFGTVGRDTDSAYNATTGKYTVQAGKGGDHLITAQIAWNAAFTGQTQLSIFRAGSQGSDFVHTNPTGSADALAVTAIINLNAGDVIDIRAYQASGVAQALNANALVNYFNLRRLS